jgi:hypothetical protein
MSLLRTLKPGDVLLYKPKGLFGWLIRVKTWHKIAHVECYVGDGLSVASRDGKGVGKYPLRSSELAVVCRPKPGDCAQLEARDGVVRDAEGHALRVG